ncbi:tail fiber protein [Fusibacter paucivorans]|uniref:Tail fiber protein n=1 Tax=Fusibacter paucivorans TaxID=76009 RepID=A0ABS5PRD9_9FIRM|nr:tail fiber protein [Fusibacter paucivorans]
MLAFIISKKRFKVSILNGFNFVQQALFNLIGVRYGGDGRTYFRLPDLRGRAANGLSENRFLGTYWGQETVELSISNMPKHTHTLMGCNADGDEMKPENNFLGIAKNLEVSLYMYGINGDNLNIKVDPIGNIGSNQAHNNIQPCLALNFCIAYEGTYPEWELDTDDEGGADV